MVLSWFSSGPEDVAGLVAKKSYAKAARILRAQLENDPDNVSLELQLADVLQLDGQSSEAVSILLLAADAYTRNGFLAKAIALLKKVQRIDPVKSEAVDRKIADLAKERDEETSRRIVVREAMLARARAGGAASPPPEAVSARASATDAAPAPPGPSSTAELEAAVTAPIPVPEAGPGSLEFELELEDGEPPAEAATGTLLEKTPLFSDFSSDELVEVIRGLRLLTFGPGEIVVAEGEPGDSLFVLTTGRVLAFCKDPRGKYHKVREMNEGSFFGEVSILTGMARTATITAATPVELLELDSDTLAGITERHPRVLTVLREFCEARAGSLDELRIRMGRTGPPPEAGGTIPRR